MNLNVLHAILNRSRVPVVTKDERSTKATKALYNRDPSIRREAANVLVKLGGHAVRSVSSVLTKNIRWTHGGLGPQQLAADVLNLIGKPAAPALAKALSHKDAKIRRLVSRALIGLKNRQTITALVKGTKDADMLVARNAVIALRDFNDPSLIRVFVAAGSHPSHAVKIEAVEALGNIGKPAVPSLIKFASRYSRGIQERAVRILGKIGDPRAIPTLRAALKMRDARVKAAAVFALGRFKNPKLINSFVSACSSPFYIIRKEAVRALINVGKVAAPQLASVLLKLMKNRIDTQLRAQIASALGKYRLPKTKPALLRALSNEPSLLARAKIAVALIAVDPNYIDRRFISILADGITSHSPSIRHSSRKLLDALVKNNAMRNMLLARLTFRNSSVRVAVAKALRKNKSSGAFKLLVNLLKDESKEVREAVTKSLGSSGNPKAIPCLIKTLDDWEYNVRKSAVAALWRLDNQKAIAAYIPVMGKFKEDVRRWMTSAISKRAISRKKRFDKIRSKAVKALIYIYKKDGSKRIRGVAFDGLLYCIDKRVVPLIISAYYKERKVSDRAHIINALGRLIDYPNARSMLQHAAKRDPNIYIRNLAWLKIHSLVN
jgi:HEAT repeat protein